MDEVWPDYPWPDDPQKVGEPWCQCEKCRAHTKEKNLQDYVIWLVGMLVSKGVGKVVMWNDQMTRHMSAFDSKFVKRLEKAGLKDRLVIDWWWYSNKELNDTTRVRVGKKLGIDGWVTPMTCYFNWSTYDYRLLNVDMMLRMGAEEGGCGAVSYAVHDTSHLDHEALLAGLAWVLGSSEPLLVNGVPFTSSFWLHTADMFVALCTVLIIVTLVAAGCSSWLAMRKKR